MHNFLTYTFVFLLAAVLAVPIFKRLGLGSVVGYLVAGLIIGPSFLGLIKEPESILHFSEYGVVLLLFIIGLELNPRRLWQMRQKVFGLGGLQVAAVGIVLSLFCYFMGLSMPASTIIGLTLALSSTAFVMQILEEKNYLKSEFGQTSFSILLFQDIAAIPLIAMVPLLGVSQQEQGNPFLMLATAIGVILALIAAGRFLLPPIFRLIAKAQSVEIFTAASLLLVVGVSLLMEKVHLSMALGAFLSGLLLANSEYRHELEANISPFKGLLLGLFFISVGMAADIALISEKWALIAGLASGLILTKFSIIYLILPFFDIRGTARRNTALYLCQGGEFGFVIFGLALQNQIFSKEIAGLLTMVITLSMAATPILIALAERFLDPTGVEQHNEYDSEFEHSDPQVIIAGFGRFGQVVGRLLRIQGIKFTTLDHTPDLIRLARKFGNIVYYGDAGRIDLLEAAGANKAKIFVLAIDNIEASLAVARLVREKFPHLKIIGRARNRTHALELMALGVKTPIRETFYSGLRAASETLVELGFPYDRAEKIVDQFRDHDEELLKEQYVVRDNEQDLISLSKKAAKRLEELLQAET